MDAKLDKSRQQPKQYWLVDIELTSGDMLQFYVSAINEFEANLKAENYAVTAEGNRKLKKFYNRFTLLP